MALVIRYFSTVAAGAGDGTSWANRAALFSSGWSTIITGFGFAAGDSLECRIGPGTYAITGVLSGGVGATSTARLVMVGADASGNRLSVPDLGWTADKPDYDSSEFPVLSTSTNIQTISANAILRLLKFVTTGSTSFGVITAREANWCVFDISGPGNSGNNGISCSVIRNCIITNNLPAFSGLVSGNVSGHIRNNRIISTTGTAGNRSGIRSQATNTAARVIGNLVFGVGGAGIYYGASHTGGTIAEVAKNTVLNCGSHGIHIDNSSAPTAGSGGYSVASNYIANCAGFGISATVDHIAVSDNRIRDCALGGMDNVTVDLGSYLLPGSDSSELADASSGDYRIKSGSTIAGMGFGVSEETSSSGPSSSFSPLGQSLICF